MLVKCTARSKSESGDAPFQQRVNSLLKLVRKRVRLRLDDSVIVIMAVPLSREEPGSRDGGLAKSYLVRFRVTATNVLNLIVKLSKIIIMTVYQSWLDFMQEFYGPDFEG